MQDPCQWMEAKPNIFRAQRLDHSEYALLMGKDVSVFECYLFTRSGIGPEPSEVDLATRWRHSQPAVKPLYQVVGSEVV